MTQSIPVSGLPLCLGGRHVSSGRARAWQRADPALSWLSWPWGLGMGSTLSCLSSTQLIRESFLSGRNSDAHTKTLVVGLPCLLIQLAHSCFNRGFAHGRDSFSLCTKGRSRTNIAKDSFLSLYQDWEQHTQKSASHVVSPEPSRSIISVDRVQALNRC